MRICSVSGLCSLTAVMLCVALPAPPASAQAIPDYDIQLSRMIPMRDGVQLEAWIFKPAHIEKPAPTVFEFTQYDIDGARRAEFKDLVARGYVFVMVYVRGRGRSGGDKEDDLGLQVGRDGYDVVEWIAKQPWSDGRVVMYGGSFVGMTQWRTAAQLPPHLAAIAPYVPIYPGWDIPNTNGIPQAWTNVILGYTSGRSLNTGFIANQDYWSGKMLDAYAHYKPFRDLDDIIGIAPDDWWMRDAQGRKESMFKVWIDHVGDEAFNLAAEPRPADFAAMHFPILTATGFYDDDQPGALHYYRRLMQYAPAETRDRTYLIIGPWDHGGTQRPSKQIEGLTIPDNAVLDMGKIHADWYDWALNRGPRPDFFRKHVAYFMFGANEWRYADSLEATSSGQSLDLFLSDPAGTPADVFHSGSLTPQPAASQPPAVVISDPHELPELAMAEYAPNEDLTSQFRDFQKRAIVFHSEPFAHPVEFAGHIRLKLAAEADTPDFDLWAQLLLVQPDGSTIRLGEDIRRARFRDGFFKQELLSPGQIVEIPFEFNWSAWRIPAGARLRLTIAPLNSPQYQKNYNTGGRIGYERIEDARIAHIQILHDKAHPSVLTLPLAAAP